MKIFNDYRIDIEKLYAKVLFKPEESKIRIKIDVILVIFKKRSKKTLK